MKLLRFLFIILALFAFEVCSATAGLYRDPGGAFTIEVPTGWEVQRNRESAGWITMISSDQFVAKVAILANPITPLDEYPNELQETMMREIAQPHFTGWVKALKSQSRVELARKVYKTMFLGSDALRMDVQYFREDKNDPRRAYALFFFKGNKAFFVTPSGSPIGFPKADKIVSTMRITIQNEPAE